MANTPTKNMTNKVEITHSQNFFRSETYVRTLINEAEIYKQDDIIEIGPGKGVITKILSDKSKSVTGIELDQKLAGQLKNLYFNSPNVRIIETDFLNYTLPSTEYKVFANIPFELTTRIINKLCNDNNPPQIAYLIVQDKAAYRIIGEPYDQNNQFSILMQPFFKSTIIKKISRFEYTPTPNVETVLLKIEKLNQPLIDAQLKNQFRDFVIYGFNQWSPNIIDAYKKIFSPNQIRIIMSDTMHGSKPKPSEVNIDQWVKLFNSFIKHVDISKKQLVIGSEGRFIEKHKKMTKLHRTR